MILPATAAAVVVLLLLSGPTGATQSGLDCESHPEACRTVAPFDLRIGDKIHPVDLQATRPWITEGRLTLYSGESVVLNLAAPGEPVVEASSAANTVISDRRATDMISLFAADGALASAEDYAGTATIEPLEDQPAMRLRVTFRQAPDSEDMLLVLENQYGKSLTYDAGMLVLGGDSLSWSPTSVCTVRPGIISMEHWPHPIMAVSLGGFAVEAPPSEEIVCR